MGEYEQMAREISGGTAAPASDARFDDWYRREAPRLTSGLAIASGNADLAAECVAEAFARAYAAWPRVQSMESPSGWVFRVAQNELRRRSRRQKREAELFASIRTDEIVESPADADLWMLVASLPDRMRLVVALRYVADLSEKDVASIMGISRGGVSSLLVKARNELTRRLGDEVINDG
jgi:RNA polymerase sigma factor (sigma-70 family)